MPLLDQMTEPSAFGKLLCEPAETFSKASDISLSTSFSSDPTLIPFAFDTPSPDDTRVHHPKKAHVKKTKRQYIRKNGTIAF